jgi:hypothetical protein
MIKLITHSTKEQARDAFYRRLATIGVKTALIGYDTFVFLGKECQSELVRIETVNSRQTIEMADFFLNTRDIVSEAIGRPVNRKEREMHAASFASKMGKGEFYPGLAEMKFAYIGPNQGLPGYVLVQVDGQHRTRGAKLSGQPVSFKVDVGFPVSWITDVDQVFPRNTEDEARFGAINHPGELKVRHLTIARVLYLGVGNASKNQKARGIPVDKKEIVAYADRDDIFNAIDFAVRAGNLPSILGSVVARAYLTRAFDPRAIKHAVDVYRGVAETTTKHDHPMRRARKEIDEITGGYLGKGDWISVYEVFEVYLHAQLRGREQPKHKMWTQELFPIP